MIKEGYKVYDADGNLKEVVEDEVIEEKDFDAALKELEHSHIFSFEKGEEYVCSIDTEENTYEIRCRAKSDVAEWERFTNKNLYFYKENCLIDAIKFYAGSTNVSF